MLLMPINIHAAGTSKDLRKEYQDLQVCMNRTLGPQWAERFGVKQVLNDYGVLEPTEFAVDASPQVVRITEMRCRFQSGLQGEGHPSATAQTGTLTTSPGKRIDSSNALPNQR